MLSNGLKIRCPQGRAGSTPALGTNHFNNYSRSLFELNLTTELTPLRGKILIEFLRKSLGVHVSG